MRTMMGSWMVVAAMALPVTAQAQNETAVVTHTEGTSRAVEYRFGDQLVQSSLVRPDTTRVVGRRPGAGPSLLRIRSHFVPEMLKSVEQL